MIEFYFIGCVVSFIILSFCIYKDIKDYGCQLSDFDLGCIMYICILVLVSWIGAFIMGLVFINYEMKKGGKCL